jgi:hypothetical protein
LIQAFVKERIFTLDNFVKQDPERPIIGTTGVPIVFYYLRRQVIRRPTHCKRLFIRFQKPGESEVSYQWLSQGMLLITNPTIGGEKKKQKRIAGENERMSDRNERTEG